MFCSKETGTCGLASQLTFCASRSLYACFIATDCFLISANGFITTLRCFGQTTVVFVMCFVLGSDSVVFKAQHPWQFVVFRPVWARLPWLLYLTFATMSHWHPCWDWSSCWCCKCLEPFDWGDCYSKSRDWSRSTDYGFTFDRRSWRWWVWRSECYWRWGFFMSCYCPVRGPDHS